MKIAVAYENEEVICSNGNGYGALAVIIFPVGIAFMKVLLMIKC